MTLNYGTCKVNSDFNLAFEDSEFSEQWKNYIDHLADDTTIGFSFGEAVRIFKLRDVRFKSQSDAQLCKKKIKDLQKTGDPYKVEWNIHSSVKYFKFDGDTGHMMCLCNKVGRLRKPSLGDDQIYHVGEIEFEEADK